jgi:hypothetical protein
MMSRSSSMGLVFEQLLLIWNAIGIEPFLFYGRLSFRRKQAVGSPQVARSIIDSELPFDVLGLNDSH